MNHTTRYLPLESNDPTGYRQPQTPWNLYLVAIVIVSLVGAGCFRAAREERRRMTNITAGLASGMVAESASVAAGTMRVYRATQRSTGHLTHLRAVKESRQEANHILLDILPRAEDAAIIADVATDAAESSESARFLRRPCRMMSDEGLCLRRDLDRFFEKLRGLWLKQSDTIASFSQLGDSLVNNDYYTAALRKRFQERFGDAGYGFLYISNPKRLMGFQGIRLGLSDDWKVRTVIREDPDNGDQFGMAGAEFIAYGHPTLTILSDFEENDRRFQRFGILAQVPDGVTDATTRLKLKDGEYQLHHKPQLGGEGIAWVEVPEPVSRAVFDQFDPRLRYYGVLLQTGDPGVVVDQMGLVSGRIFFLLKIDRQQWAEHIQLRDPDVISLWYGVNSSGMSRARFNRRADEYRQQYDEVLRRVREDQPDRDCLVISVGTRGDQTGRGVVNDDSLDLVRDVQDAASAEANCAFLDAYHMIGGQHSAPQWHSARPQLMGDDLHHFTIAGYRRFGDLVEAQLLRAFIDYIKERRMRIQAGHPPYAHIEEPMSHADSGQTTEVPAETEQTTDGNVAQPHIH